jgi:hypothetical protein
LEKYFQKTNPGAPFGTASGNGAHLDQQQQQFAISSPGVPNNNGDGNGDGNNFENGPPLY